MIEAMPNTAPKKPCHSGLFARGRTDSIRTIAPDMMPADPIPAIALPIMKATEFGAAPHIADPTSKRPIKPKKIYFGE